MTSSAHGAAASWDGDATPPVVAPDQPSDDWDVALDDADPLPQSPHPDSTSEWEQVDETVSPGLSGRVLIVITTLAVAGSAILDLALTGGTITFFFDLCFVVVCLVAAIAVRRMDVFTAGVLPPLVFAGVIATVSLARPQAFASGPAADTAFLTGLADHAPGLVGGYAVALMAVAARVATSGSRTR